MPRLLSQEEIDALLAQVPEESGEETGGPKDAAAAPEKRAQVYDFKRPDRLSKENIRSLHLIHDRFARSCSASFSAYLRTMSDVNLLSVDQFTYFEFLMSLPDPTCLNILSMRPLEGNAALEINPSIVFPVIDKLLGGPGQPLAEVREMTDIEFSIIEGMLKQALKDLQDAWSQAIEIEIAIIERETTPQLMQIAAPNEPVVLVTFEVKIAELSGMMNLCIPSRMLEPVINRFTQDWYSISASSQPARTKLYINELLNEVPLPISVFLGECRLAVQDIVDLEVGDLVVLGTHTNTPLTVRVGGVPKFRASIGEHSRRAAVKVLSRIEKPTSPLGQSAEVKRADEGADEQLESNK